MPGLTINIPTERITAVTRRSSSSDFDNHYSVSVVAPGAAYTFTPSKKLYVHAGVSATFYHSKVSDVTDNKTYPSINLNMSWMPHESHRIRLGFNYALNAPDGAQTNAALTRTDMLKWSQGNPHLKSYNMATTQLAYTWNISQCLSKSPTATWVYNHNYYTDTYSLTDDGKGILVKPENCGNYHNVWGSLNFAGYFLDRKLVIQLYPSISYHRFTGLYDISHASFEASASASYYMGQCYIAASCTTPRDTI